MWFWSAFSHGGSDAQLIFLISLAGEFRWHHTWHYLCLTFCGHRTNKMMLLKVYLSVQKIMSALPNTWDMSDSIFLKCFTFPLPKKQDVKSHPVCACMPSKATYNTGCFLSEFQQAWRHQCICGCCQTHTPWLCVYVSRPPCLQPSRMTRTSVSVDLTRTLPSGIVFAF